MVDDSERSLVSPSVSGFRGMLSALQGTAKQRDKTHMNFSASALVPHTTVRLFCPRRSAVMKPPSLISCVLFSLFASTLYAQQPQAGAVSFEPYSLKTYDQQEH